MPHIETSASKKYIKVDNKTFPINNLVIQDDQGKGLIGLLHRPTMKVIQSPIPWDQYSFNDEDPLGSFKTTYGLFLELIFA